MNSFTINSITSDGHETMATKILLKVMNGVGPRRIIVDPAQREGLRASLPSGAECLSPQYQEHRFELLSVYLNPYLQAASRDLWKIIRDAISLTLVNGGLTAKHTLRQAAVQVAWRTPVARLLIAA